MNLLTLKSLPFSQCEDVVFLLAVFLSALIAVRSLYSKCLRPPVLRHPVF